MDPVSLTLVVTGAFAGGFVSGLSGFALGLVALGFWLHVLDPVLAGPLVVLASVIAQSQSLLAVRRAFDWRRLMPFLIAGLIGVPLGIAALGLVPAAAIRGGLGGFLVLYAGFLLLRPAGAPLARVGRAWDATIGFVGGLMCGVGGLSGAIPSAWLPLRGWAKDQIRAVLQPYNLLLQIVTMAGYVGTGLLDRAFWQLSLWAAPPVLLGGWLGLKLYARLDEAQFRRVVLVLLLGSGSVLAIQALLAI